MSIRSARKIRTMTIQSDKNAILCRASCAAFDLIKTIQNLRVDH